MNNKMHAALGVGLFEIIIHIIGPINVDGQSRIRYNQDLLTNVEILIWYTYKTMAIGMGRSCR